MNSSSEKAIFRWKPAAWLHVGGSDADTFLQGQFTNDLRKATSDNAVYGLWLTVKGKVLADSFIVRSAGEAGYWIGSYFAPAAVIRARLESHIIADDVTLDDQTEQWTGLTVFTPDEIRPGPNVVRFAGRRDRSTHEEIVFSAAAGSQAVPLPDGVRELTADEMEARRIAAGIPAIPRDLGPGDLPNEGGLEEEAISYTKGCYLGQEVMARLKSMGQVRRRLVHVVGMTAPPNALPAPLFLGDKPVGELRSAIKLPDGALSGLAMITLLQAPPGAEVALAPNAEPALRLASRR